MNSSFWLQSFQYPLPWSECPKEYFDNGSYVINLECKVSLAVRRFNWTNKIGLSMREELFPNLTYVVRPSEASESELSAKCFPWWLSWMHLNCVRTQRSSPTQYFWYRETLDISPDINTPQSFNWTITLCLLLAWLLAYLCMAKGLKYTEKLKDRIENVYDYHLWRHCVVRKGRLHHGHLPLHRSHHLFC